MTRCVLLAAALCLSSHASAQEAVPMERDGHAGAWVPLEDLREMYAALEALPEVRAEAADERARADVSARRVALLEEAARLDAEARESLEAAVGRSERARARSARQARRRGRASVYGPIASFVAGVLVAVFAGG